MKIKNNKTMKKISLLVLTIFLLVNCKPSEKQNKSQAQFIAKATENPVYPAFNKPIDFASITQDDVKDAVISIKQISDNALNEIISVKEGERTFDNTMKALDNLYGNLDMISSTIYLIAYTHPDSLIRNEALQSNTVLDKYLNNIRLNESLYKAVKTYAQSKEANALKGYQAKFLLETITKYEQNGFALSNTDRNQLKTINDELSALAQQFSKNIASYKDSLIVSESDMKGLPEEYKKARKLQNGSYKIDLSYPSYFPFIRYSKSDKARKQLFKKYNNRAAPENLEVLQQLLQKRLKKANLLGYKTFSEYTLENLMAKNPSTVWEFETSLKDKVKAKSKEDIKELLAIKNRDVKDSDIINRWEYSYYTNMLIQEKYQLNIEEVKQYFMLDDVIDGLFKITQSLFNLEYKEVKNPSVWHEDVRMFEVYQDHKIKGVFYLDLYPRDHKYNHAGCFPIINGRMTEKGYQLPNASLVCNFPKPTEDKPALMPHTDVVNFFHEFGHVIHHIVTTANLHSQAGTNVTEDFSEAPSQILENWAWKYEAVKLFAKHFKTREVIPQELFDKMLASRDVGSGIKAANKLFLGTYDLTLNDTYDPFGEESTTDVFKNLQNDIMPFPYVEGTHFQASVDHLVHYGSTYYGYLWSLVYAQDMFSVFEENGILDETTGLRFRDIVLANGNSKEALDLVKKFLGREPNNLPFLKGLGLETQ